MEEEKKIKLIEWEFDDVMGELKRISLVSDPAIDEDFMLFNTELKFQTIDDEKRVVTGPAMIPDMKIPRRDENNELYYGFFSSDTVERAAQIFFKKGSNTNNTNLEHEFEVSGVNFFESWIVTNPEMDKSKELGFNVPKGTWMTSAKIDNDVVWNNYIKSGLIKGFSVEVRAQEVEILSKINDILDADLSDDIKWDNLLDLIKTQK
jgi:hypothetical protein